MITKWSHQKYNTHTLPFAEERDAPDVAPLDKGGLSSQIRQHNVVARLHFVNVLADLLDNAGALMAEDGGQGDRKRLVTHAEVRMADPRTHNAH
jgi:hypothetical protein